MVSYLIFHILIHVWDHFTCLRAIYIVFKIPLFRDVHMWVKKIQEWNKEWASSYFPRFIINSFSVIHAKPVYTSCIKYFILAKILIVLLEKKSNHNFLWISTSAQYIIINYNVSRNSVGWLKGVATTISFSQII